MTDNAKFVTDRAADASLFAALFGLLPAIVAVLGAVYYALQIWESKTVQEWRARRAVKLATLATGIDLSDGLTQEAERLKKLVALQLMSLWSKAITGIAALGAMAVQMNEIIQPASYANPYLQKVSMALTLIAAAASAFSLVVHWKKAAAERANAKS